MVTISQDKILISKVYLIIILSICGLRRCAAPGFPLQYFALRDKMISAAIPNPFSMIFSVIKIFIGFCKWDPLLK